MIDDKNKKICFLDIEAINQEQVLQVALVDDKGCKLFNKYCYVEGNISQAYLKYMYLDNDECFKNTSNTEMAVFSEFNKIVKDYDIIFHFECQDKEVLKNRNLVDKDTLDKMIDIKSEFDLQNYKSSVQELYYMLADKEISSTEHNALDDALKLCLIYNNKNKWPELFNSKEILRPIKYIKPVKYITNVIEGNILNLEYKFIFVFKDKPITIYNCEGDIIELPYNVNDENAILANIKDLINNSVVVTDYGKGNDYFNRLFKKTKDTKETWFFYNQVFINKYLDLISADVRSLNAKEMIEIIKSFYDDDKKDFSTKLINKYN